MRVARPALARFFVAALLCSSGAPAVSFADAQPGGALLSELEADVLRELNLARTDPARAAKQIERWRGYYDGNIRRAPGEVAIRTKEGLAALEEAIAFLKSTKPLEPLEPSKGMSKGAADHVRDSGPKGRVSHDGSDGSTMGERVNRYGVWKECVGENISYGKGGGRDVVLKLIIDDGVADRGHRSNIFNPDFRRVGVACGDHRAYETMCVMTFAGAYLETPP